MCQGEETGLPIYCCFGMTQNLHRYNLDDVADIIAHLEYKQQPLTQY